MWLPIESASEDYSQRLLFGKFRRGPEAIVIGYYESDGYTHGWTDGSRDFYATHWMPLPEPPHE